MALRGSKRISLSTRQRIASIAAELDYRPDPALKALAAYRSRNQISGKGNVLAIVTEQPGSERRQQDWKEAVQTRASELGYKVETFHLEAPGSQWRALTRTFRARGIRGIFLAPRSAHDEPFEAVDLSEFALVTVGFSVQLRQIARFTTNQFQHTFQNVQHLHRLGYRRPAIWVTRNADERLRWQFSGGYLASVECLGLPPIRPHRGNITEPEKFLAWFHKAKPDVILGLPKQLQIMRQIGVRVPEDVAFSTYDWHGGPEVQDITGMNYAPDKIAGEAINGLHSLLLSGRFGILEDSPITVFRAHFMHKMTTPEVTS